MRDTNRNAAISFQEDGFNPDAKGINGRRVAGASFLRGFFAHADVDEFVSLSHGNVSKESFAALLKESGRDIPHRAVLNARPRSMAPVGTLYRSDPVFFEPAWQRERFGARRWSICGITHTTATNGTMQGLFNLRTAPQREWDGLICTSRAVKASTSRNFDLIDDYLHKRFGNAPPPRPQMPVIPLGIDCAEHSADEAARRTLRDRHGWGENDVVFVTLARLTPTGKFDPVPFFVALRAARDRLPNHIRLHVMACGVYPDNHSQRVYETAARELLPEMSFVHMDGADPVARKETMSGGDVFFFPVDHIQETFGLAPVEAMAAGLPVLTSDWDGMRDTISEDVGIRVPTTTVSGAHTHLEAWRYQSGYSDYSAYGASLSAMTALDMGAMVDGIVALASDPDLRRKMGQAGQARARTHYDWSVVIPQMQDFWAELAAIRTRSSSLALPNAIAPAPFDLFSAYPTDQIGTDEGRYIPLDSPYSVADVYRLRRMSSLKQQFEPETRVDAVHKALMAAGPEGATARDLADVTGIAPVRIERACLFLMKFGMAQHEPN